MIEMNKPVYCNYKKFSLFKAIPYYIFWPITGLFSFLVGFLILFLLDEEIYLWTYLIFSSYLMIGPTAVIWGRNTFEKRMNNVKSLFRDTENEFEVWLREKINQIFTLNPFYAKFSSILITIFGSLTIILLGLPFENFYIKILGSLTYAFMFFICGHIAYIVIALLSALHQLVQKEPEIDFFQFSHPAISKLQNFFSTISIGITLGYVSLVIAIMKGPYDFSEIFQIWLSILAFIPIMLFTISYSEIHDLLRKIKFSSIKTINIRVQEMLEKINEKSNLKDLEKLEKIMDIQDKVHSIPEWPFDIQGIATFLIALTTAIIQVATVWVGKTP